MRILLIGGNGFIGRFLVPALQCQGHSLALFHRGTTTTVPTGVEDIRGNRNQLQASAQELKKFAPEVVIDLIVSSGSQAEDLMNAFRGSANRIVMLSSMDVYRAIAVLHGTEDGPLEPLPLTEESALRRTLHTYTPDILQGLRKTFAWVTDDYDKIPAERVVMNDPDLPGTVLRLPMIYGPGDHLHRFFPIVKRISDGRRYILFADALAAWRSPRGYVENVAAAVALAATESRAAGRIYNVCEEPPFSELEWARKIADEMQWKGEFVTLPAERTPAHLLRPGNAAQHWTASSARIRRELGYQEPVAMEQAIRETIRWELENPPALPFAPVFDYAAEDSALASKAS
ncbi:MAG TPA: NAD-dependent epimerase/dehydratase family protein [Candidatus Sulfotelmatobacter sp.]|nr:NAD-dependent epimerase/dehydratase family protein [Candidatus Sulfotelmatobacter sp.]